jgi:2-keto-4-pentenoate hydratase/2-oxohepta-3-ene-1,7-dioic acid hydratase in catechol pathway
LGAFVGAQVVDLPEAVGHPAFPSTMEALVSRPRGTVLDAARHALERDDALDCAVEDAQLLAPILPPSLSESDYRWVVAPGEELSAPPQSPEVHFDMGIAAVIYRPKKSKLRPSQARECIFGYTLMTYWSAGDEFGASLGPCIVTEDEFDSASDVVVTVNGREWARGSVDEDAEVSFADQIVTTSKTAHLLPGEVFGSGTLGSRKNGKAPKAGSDIELVVAGIGSLQNSLAPRLGRRAAS